MLVGQNNWGRQGGMLVGQTAGVGREECWLVRWLGKVGRYVGRSNCWGR